MGLLVLSMVIVAAADPPPEGFFAHAAQFMARLTTSDGLGTLHEHREAQASLHLSLPGPASRTCGQYRGSLHKSFAGRSTHTTRGSRTNKVLERQSLLWMIHVPPVSLGVGGVGGERLGVTYREP